MTWVHREMSERPVDANRRPVPGEIGVSGMPPNDQRYLPLKDLAVYSGLSVRTLRSHLAHPTHPLPHFHVGGKILVRQAEFDAWVTQFRVATARVSVGELVADVLDGLG